MRWRRKVLLSIFQHPCSFLSKRADIDVSFFLLKGVGEGYCSLYAYNQIQHRDYFYVHVYDNYFPAAFNVCLYSRGTLDITVHAIQDDGTIKEIHKVTGGPHGGIKVNEQFENLLEELVGEKKIINYRQKFPSDWLALINEFEAKKRGKRIVDRDVTTNLRVPRSFVSMVNESQSSTFARYESSQVKLKNREYLALGSEMMRKLFRLTLKRIVDHLKGLMEDPKISKVQTMLLVGGFADSALLQEEIKSAFSKRVKVLIPNHASEAVVQGAALFGKKTAKISERVVSTTYAAGCSRGFIEGVHPEDKKFFVDGTARCNDLLSFFVKENASVRIGEKVTKMSSPLYADAEEITYHFYSASNPDSQFTTDPGVTMLGSVTVKSPETWRGEDRDIEVSMYFGRTEITATALDVSSGNVKQTTIDFLNK